MTAPARTASGQAGRKWALMGILALALVTVLGLTLASSAEAKKKKKSASVFNAQVSPNAAIPDGPTTGPATPVVSTITVGKKFKGKVIGDVNVTGIQTTGNSSAGPGSANDVGSTLTAPNGRIVLILNGGLQGPSIGPLTLDDDVFQSICFSTTPCSRPEQSLNPPYAGTANLLFIGSGGTGPLSAFDGLPMKGTWTLRVFDFNNNNRTSVLNAWGLQITAAKPVT